MKSTYKSVIFEESQFFHCQKLLFLQLRNHLKMPKNAVNITENDFGRF